MARIWSDGARRFLEAVPLNEKIKKLDWCKQQFEGLNLAVELDLDLALQVFKDFTLDEIMAGFRLTGTYIFDAHALADVLLAMLDQGLAGKGEVVNGLRCVSSAQQDLIRNTAPSKHVARAYCEAGLFPSAYLVALDGSKSMDLGWLQYFYLDKGRHDDVSLFIEQGYRLADSESASSVFTKDTLRDEVPMLAIQGGEDPDKEGLKRLVDLRTGIRFVAITETVLDESARKQLLYALEAGLVPVVRTPIMDLGLKQRPDIVETALLKIARTFDAKLIDAAAKAIENSPFEPKLYLDAKLGELENRDDLADVLANHPDMVDPSVIVQGELWCESTSKEVRLQEGVTAIRPYAFVNIEGCLSFDEAMRCLGKEPAPIGLLALPDTLVSIGRRAFYDNLPTCVELPKSLERIGAEALHGAQVIRIYDQAEEKPKRKTKAALQVPQRWTEIGNMSSVTHAYAVNYDVVVLDKTTDRVKFRVHCPLKRMSESADWGLRTLWKNTATFSFYAFDSHFEYSGLGKEGKAINAVYRLAYPVELEDDARKYYTAFLKDPDKVVGKAFNKALKTLLLDGEIDAVERVCALVPLSATDAAKHLKTVQKSKELDPSVKEKITAILEAVQ